MLPGPWPMPTRPWPGPTPDGRVEVRRFASRLALYTGCDAALPYLEPLADDGNAEDAVLLAECTADPAAARALLEGAVDQLEGTWKTRARTALKTLEGR